MPRSGRKSRWTVGRGLRFGQHRAESARSSSAPDVSPQAATVFEGPKDANRSAVLYRIAAAKRPEARACKIAQFVDILTEVNGVTADRSPSSPTLRP